MTEIAIGKINSQDERIAGLLKWLPWVSFFFIALVPPLPLLFFYLNSATTETAAIFLLLSLGVFGGGIVMGALLVIGLLIYRTRWLSRLRDRLAADGITAAEVKWFMPELTSEERRNFSEIQKTNPLLADAYCETLASRLMATRIISLSKRESLKVERRINNTRMLEGADTSSLLAELDSDLGKLQKLQLETSARLAEAKARLQMIEAAASRTLGQAETDLMLQRLSAAQAQMPLAIEMTRLEQEAAREVEIPELTNRST